MDIAVKRDEFRVLWLEELVYETLLLKCCFVNSILTSLRLTGPESFDLESLCKLALDFSMISTNDSRAGSLVFLCLGVNYYKPILSHLVALHF